MQENNTRDAVLRQLLQQCIPVVDVCIQIVVPYTVEPKIICCIWSWKGPGREEKLERSIRSVLHIVDHLCIYTTDSHNAQTEKELEQIFRKLDLLIPWTVCSDRESYKLGPFVHKVCKIMQKDTLKWDPKYTYVMYLQYGEILQRRSCDSARLQLPFNDLLQHDAYVGNYTETDDALTVTVRRRFLTRSSLHDKRDLERPLWKHHYICCDER